MALFPEIFSYDRLYEAARPTMRPALRDLFESVGTRDFERIMRLLQDSEIVCRSYLSDEESARRMQGDRAHLLDLLVNAIAERYPESKNSVSDAAYERCWTFVSDYANLFTLNYDLLLYWVLMWKFERTSRGITSVRGCPWFSHLP